MILCGTVALTVLLSSRRIKKTEPVAALRRGILTHNFKKNHVPLANCGAPLNIALAFKTTLYGMKYNITVCITMLVLSLAVVFSGQMTQNMLLDRTPFINLIVGETADSAININAVIENDFLKEMNADRRVEKIYLYNDITVSHVGGIDLMATVCEDFSETNNQNIVFEGRFPRFDNEIAVAAKYARENDLHIGDEITISAGGNEAKYLISGFTQLTNNLGKDCLLTRAGYERIGTLQNTTYYLNLEDGADIEAFHAETAKRFGSNVNLLVNIKTTIDGSASVYVSLMTVIVVAILMLSLIIIVFVLFLLVRTMLNNKRLDYGIMKALGFTTGQLMCQTAASFMPSVILSTTVGILISSLVINHLISLFLYGIGIVKCTFTVPIVFLVAAGIGLILFTFGIACLMSLKIKGLAPRRLLAGE